MKQKIEEGFGLKSYSLCQLSIWDAAFVVKQRDEIKRILENHGKENEKKEYIQDKTLENVVKILDKLIPQGFEVGHSEFEEDLTQVP